MCSTPPSWSVIMQHNDCIDIVRHTTEFYLSDTRLYRCIFIVFILWVTHQNFMCSTTPSWWVILQNNYCMDIVSNASELHVFDNPIVMGLYCRIIIVWILWVTRRNFMCSTIPSWWVILQDNYCSDIVTSVIKHFSFHRSLNLGNLKKPLKTRKLGTWELMSLFVETSQIRMLRKPKKPTET